MKMLARVSVALLVTASFVASAPAFAIKEVVYFPPSYSGRLPFRICLPDANADSLVAANAAAYPLSPSGICGTSVASPPVIAAAGTLDFSDATQSALIL